MNENQEIIENDKLMTWEELKETIPERLNSQIDRIRKWKNLSSQ